MSLKIGNVIKLIKGHSWYTGIILDVVNDFYIIKWSDMQTVQRFSKTDLPKYYRKLTKLEKALK